MDLVTVLPDLLSPLNFALIFLGTCIGLVVGVIPGLSASMAVALLIPFTYSLSSMTGMSMLVAVYVGGISGGCVTAILLRIPGTPSSVATIFDGYPMAEKGQAGRALGAAVISSAIGTLVSAAILIFAAPIVARFAVKFYFPEYTAVCIFGLAAVAALSADSLVRGLLSTVVGLLVATVGISESDGLPRFTFGHDMLLGGINLLPALIGMYAIAQIMTQMRRTDETKATMVAVNDRVLPRREDITENLFNFVRSSILGTLIGIIPAMGGGPAGLISYAQAKNASKRKNEFGKGIPAGVIASETANNATIGGALIVMLTLGIPGDPVSAILIGGLMIHGLQPGPQLFAQNPEVIYGIYLSVLLATAIMAIVLLVAARHMARIARIPEYYLHPALIILATTGVYALNTSLFDVGVMFGFGLLGYLFERCRIPLAPMVLGLVLGATLESNFRKMVGAYGDATPLFTQPIALAFLILAVVAMVYSIAMPRIAARKERRDLALGRTAGTEPT